MACEGAGFLVRALRPGAPAACGAGGACLDAVHGVGDDVLDFAL